MDRPGAPGCIGTQLWALLTRDADCKIGYRWRAKTGGIATPATGGIPPVRHLNLFAHRGRASRPRDRSVAEGLLDHRSAVSAATHRRLIVALQRIATYLRHG